MLFAPVQPLAAGDTVTWTLHCADAGSVAVTATVRDAPPTDQ